MVKCSRNQSGANCLLEMPSSSSGILLICSVISSIVCSSGAFPIANESPLFPLSIIHINDFHARFEPTNIYGGTCNNISACIGGYGRIVATVKRLQQEQKHLNPLYLNAGDNFQGTLWYNVGRWNVTSQFLNMLPPDALNLGNHEFDHGVEGVVPFVETITSPVIMTNMDASEEPTLDGKFHKSIIIERDNRKIGIMGVIVENVPEIARTERLRFFNESESIREEAANLKAQGANILIVISHCGYDVDQIIAREVGDFVDVIVGGHSHSFLYTGTPLPGPDQPRGDYPTEIIHKSGNRVLIVQAASYAKYVGNLVVYFDEDGGVVKHEGSPIYMDSSIPQDPDVQEAMKPWQEIIDAKGNVIIGESLVDLEKAPCNHMECNLGNFFCDATIYSFTTPEEDFGKAWTAASICLVNSGALRVPLSRGNITYSHLITMSPFENQNLVYDIPGQQLKEALEYAVSYIDLDNNKNVSWVFLQVAGLKVHYDFHRQPYDRVVDLKVRCRVCSVPVYEPFDPEASYRIATTSFLQNGGDGFTMLRDYATNIQAYGTDLDALLRYTAMRSPIYQGTEGRIKVTDQGH